jgi:hypothetical protein
MLGLERSLGTRIVTYADDLVILCRKGKAEEALHTLLTAAEALARMLALRAEAKTYREIAGQIATEFGITLRPMTIKRILGRQHQPERQP